MRPAMSCAAAGAILLACIAAPTSRAAITVTKANGTAVPEGSFTIAYNDLAEGFDVTLTQLYAQWSETVYNIHVNGGETIANLIIDIDGPPAGSPLTVRVLSEAPGGAFAIKNIAQFGNAETQLLLVQAAQDIGSVQAEVIGNIVAGRDVIGPVVSTTP